MHYNLKYYSMELLRIKEVLKEKRVTVVSLAETIGVAQPSMSNIVNGRTTPSLDTLRKIAKALDVAIQELFAVPNNELYGLVQYKGITYKIDSVGSIESLLRTIKENSSLK